MRIKVKFIIGFQAPVKLTDLRNHRKELSYPGVYLIVKSNGKPSEVSPFSKQVVYIGKAIRETIFSRNVKHLGSVMDRRLNSGRPMYAPGSRFIRFRESIKRDPSTLWVIPSLISQTYKIWCAEEFLLFEYRRRRGDLPVGNTKGTRWNI